MARRPLAWVAIYRHVPGDFAERGYAEWNGQRLVNAKGEVPRTVVDRLSARVRSHRPGPDEIEYNGATWGLTWHTF